VNLGEDKERLRWEGFAGKGGFKPGMNLFITHEAAKINQSINQSINLSLYGSSKAGLHSQTK